MKITGEEHKVIKIDPCCPKMVEHYGMSFKKFFDIEDKVFFWFLILLTMKSNIVPFAALELVFCMD